LFELRCLLDWTVTSTTLSFYHWLKLEDIYASLYNVKGCMFLCSASSKTKCNQFFLALVREMEKRENRQLGEERGRVEKWGMGYGLIVVFILLLWFPLILLSLPISTVSNPPISIQARLGFFFFFFFFYTKKKKKKKK